MSTLQAHSAPLKKLAQTQVELSGWVPIKIVANGGTVAIFVNDELGNSEANKPDRRRLYFLRE